jgi:hypothetical protein
MCYLANHSSGLTFGHKAGKEMVLGNGLSLVALLDRVLENKESADGPEVGVSALSAVRARSFVRCTDNSIL